MYEHAREELIWLFHVYDEQRNEELAGWKIAMQGLLQHL